MNMQPAISSNITGFCYVKPDLFVEFKGGAVYKYRDVPAETFEIMEAMNLVLKVYANPSARTLLAIPAAYERPDDLSIGKYLNKHIKGIYEFEKVISAE